MSVEPQKYKSLEETSLQMINTKEELDSLVTELKKYKEIAIDLEVSKNLSLLFID